jgi:hypothetical protein
MSTNKRAAEEEPDADTHSRSTKRSRLNTAPEETTACFDDLNGDCLVNVLSCLPSDDMNSVAICSKRCREARANDSLDQTRTGTIMCTENTTIESIRNAFVRQEWNEVFSGHRTRLKVVGLESMPRLREDIKQSPNHVLPHVSSLDLSFNSFAGDDNLRHNKTVAFARMLPNLEEIDLSHTTGMPLGCARDFRNRYCRNLCRVIWNSSQQHVGLSDMFLPQAMTEIYLDNSQIFTPLVLAQLYFSAFACSFMFQTCNRLERLSIMNTTWTSYGSETTQPVAQEMLIKMVRLHPTLRWLRSDLTDENIAMLQQERPDITFVSK